MRLKASRSIKAATSRLVSKRGKKKQTKGRSDESTDGQHLDPQQPPGTVPQQTLLDWGRACGFSLLRGDVANEVAQILLHLEASKVDMQV